ncbi:hypothetical protein ACA910_013781 [Epithemia clementina (nom. ined.)]
MMIGRSFVPSSVLLLFLVLQLLQVDHIAAEGGPLRNKQSSNDPQQDGVAFQGQSGEAFGSVNMAKNSSAYLQQHQQEQEQRNLAPCGAPGKCADVFIIGAGMSGAAAAREITLYNKNNGNKADITYIWAEAGNGIGGRMRRSSQKLGGVFVEDGANWCQGAGNNPIHLLIKQYNIQSWEQKWDNYALYQEKDDGNGGSMAVPVKQPETSFNAFYDALNCVEEEGFRRYKLAQQGLDEGEDMSVRDFLRTKCTPPWEPGNLEGGSTKAVDWAVEWYNLDYEFAVEPKRISLNAYPLFSYGYDFQAKDLLVTDSRGFQEIARRYSAQATRPITGTRVQTVKWDENLEGGYRAKITTDKGVYWAKKVITTPSVGVYLNNPSLFDPKPVQNLNALNRVFQMANVAKLYFRFDREFWDKKEFIMIARKDERNRGLCNSWQNLNFPSSQRYTHGSNILTCFLTTENIAFLKSTYGTDTLNHPDVLEEVLQPLKLLYGENLPNYEFYYHDWENDPTTYGAYENWKIGGKAADFRAFTTPLSQLDAGNIVYNVVHWAGSASCSRHWGLTHGALMAGERAAKHVINELDTTANLDTASLCDEEPGNGYCCFRPRTPRGAS